MWVRPADLARLDAQTRETLRSGGIGELFLEAGRLAAGTGSAPRVESALEDLAGVARLRMPVTLVVTGEWPGMAAGDDVARRVAGEMAGELRRLRLRAEELGLTPVGYHLDVAPPPGSEALESWAAVLTGLRESVDTDVHLSASLDPASLDREGIARVARAVDFVVPFLYGVRPDGGPAPAGESGWDLARAEESLEQLAELDRPFLVGVGTLGVLRRIDSTGQPVEETAAAGLRELVRHRDLERGRTAVLDGLDRKDYLFEVTAPARVAGWSLGQGERLQVIRPYPYHVRELVRRAEAAAPESHLGQLFFRLPAPQEGLSMDAAALAAVEADRSAKPVLAVQVEPVGDRRSRFRVKLVNEGAHATDLASLETNYVELRTHGGGTFGSVDAGDFQRYQLEHQGERVAHMRALRSADGVKLFAPLVEPGDVVESGVLVLRNPPGRGPVVDVSGVFVAPSGDLVELPVQRWPAPPAEAAVTAEGP